MGLSGLVLLAVFAGPVSAAPIDDKRAEAQAIQDQIDANGEKIGALSEAFNGAQLRFDEAQQAVTAAEAQIAATKAEVRHTRALLRERAAAVYRHALSGQTIEDFDVQNARRFNSRREYAKAQARQDDALLVQLDELRSQLDLDRAKAESARAQADAERTEITNSRAALEAANAEQQQLLAKVQGELAQLVREEAARREAEAVARARVRFGASGGDGNPGAFPNVPPPSGGAATAIAFARAQLGKPYVYAAAGPDAYDCSGLTMAAWAAAGVSMPHYSGAQYTRFPRVPLDEMLPGDLVFWGPGGSSHVGLYVGNGLMIHAPHTGDVVKVAAVYGHPVGAVRPG
jgi:cell wall-associated NlpC family hydrolase